MKFKILTAVFILTYFMSFGQRKELRQAERALDNDEFYIAKKLLQQAEPEISSEKDRIKARFYMAKGWTFLGLNSDIYATAEGYETTEKSFNKAIRYGRKQDGKTGLHQLEQVLVTNALDDRDDENFTSAYKKLYRAYQLSPKDTVYLLAAAGNAFKTADTDTAIRFYKKLKDLNYKGNQKQFAATDKASGKKQVFQNQNQRDLFIESGRFENPENFRERPKNGLIIRQLALLYLRKNHKDQALHLIDEAKKANPGDLQILQAEAEVYGEIGEEEKYKHLFNALINKDPDHAERYYLVLGENALDRHKQSRAEDYFHKAAEANPESVNAYRALANITLQKQFGIIDEMKSLKSAGKAGSEDYDKLDKKRRGILQDALPYLEKIHQHDPQDFDTVRTLYQINLVLGHSERADHYRKAMKKLAEKHE